MSSIYGQWSNLLDMADSDLEAVRRYSGRSVSEAITVAKSLKAEIYFVSAGLGLVHATDQIPDYDLTTAVNGTLRSLVEDVWDPNRWWDLISKQNTRHSLAKVLGQGGGICLISLPSAYLELISGDLQRIPSNQAAQVRIFTSRPGVQYVPDALLQCVMPYDSRLDGPDTRHPG